MSKARPASASIDPAEIAQFSGHAADWWNPEGAMKPLHRLNPPRLEYIRARVIAHFGRAADAAQPLAGLDVLDVGCGAGLLCEPLARLGGRVTGLDASGEAIAAARDHAVQAGLEISYRADSAEAFAATGARFDVITALEILEHVADIPSLMRSLAAMLKPGGLLILSTVNRTAFSYLTAVVAAEYILKWLPEGTHDWGRFLKPSELAAQLDKAGLRPDDMCGVIYDPLQDEFRLKQDRVAINYLMTAVQG